MGQQHRRSLQRAAEPDGCLDEKEQAKGGGPERPKPREGSGGWRSSPYPHTEFALKLITNPGSGGGPVLFGDGRSVRAADRCGRRQLAV